MLKKCKCCGIEFDSTKQNRRYCSDECKKKISRERKRRKKEYVTKPNAAVIDIAVKAREAGMTYGQYVARMGGEHEKH